MPNRNCISNASRTLALGFIPLALLLLGAAAPTLDQAKAQGLVCEQTSGYLKASGNPTDAITTLVTDVNAKRKAAYAKIATKNGVTVEQVGKLTAEKLDHKCQ